MKQLVFILFTFCVISNSYAQMDCESIPSCEELGYTQESCSGGKGVRCLFDENKFYCAGAKQLPDAPDPVITPEDWTAECADKINYCTAYNNDCQCTACESGYLLSDGACVPECDKSVDICAAESKIFNAETCACEACPSGYLFDNEVNECREACKKDVDWCAEYDSKWADCKCVACSPYCDYLYLVYYDLGSSYGYNGEKGTCQLEFCKNGWLGCDYYCKRCSATEEDVCEVCADGFTLKDNKCIPPTGTCVEGSILYDDLNCYNPESVPTGRTAIGVVYRAYGRWGDGGLLALSLDKATLAWSENLANTETGCNSDTDGQANTDCIIAAGAEENSAAVYCSKYGVTDVDRGKWFLPASRQYVSDQSLGCLISFSLSKALGKSPSTSTRRLDDIIASTERSSTEYYWPSGMGGVSYLKKAKKETVRCVLDFQKLK